jgi:hypothetical protein
MIYTFASIKEQQFAFGNKSHLVSHFVRSPWCISVLLFCFTFSVAPAAAVDRLCLIMSAVFAIGDPRPSNLGQQEAGVSSSKRTKMVLGCHNYSDAVFRVGPVDATAVSIPVHSFPLRLASETFAAMFSSKWKKDEPIRITDCDESTMYSLLRWIYCDELLCEAGRLMDVLHLANKYLVNDLFDFVAKHLSADADASGIWPITTFAIKHGYTSLTDKCLSIIHANDGKALESPDSLVIAEDVAAAVVSYKDATDEMKLFEWSLKWSESECERRGLPQTAASKRITMQSFIHEIAFPAMSAKEFTGLPCSSEILTYQEVVEIMRIIAGHADQGTLFRLQSRNIFRCTSWKRGDLVQLLMCFGCKRTICSECNRKTDFMTCCTTRSYNWLPGSEHQPGHSASLCSGPDFALPSSSAQMPIIFSGGPPPRMRSNIPLNRKR